MSSTPKRPAHRPRKGARVKHTLRLPVELDAPLRQHAEAHGRSLNDELVAIVAAALNSTPEQVVELYMRSGSVLGVRDLENATHPENPQ